MAIVHLKIEDVLRNARKAFDEGRLQIQDDDLMDKGCMYAGPCAIGASLPYNLAMDLDGPTGGSNSICELLEAGRVTSDAPEDLISLQEAHDFGAIPLFKETLIAMEIEHGLRDVAD